MPILTHYLSPSDYGIISLINTYVSVLIPLISISSAGFIAVEYYSDKSSDTRFQSLFSSVSLIPLFTSALLLIIIIAGKNFLPALLELPQNAYWLLVPITLFVVYSDGFSSFLVISKRSILFSASSVSKIFIEIPLTLFLIISIGLQWDGRIYSWLTATVLFSLLGFYFYKRWGLLTTSINKLYIRQAITFGAPLIMHEMGKFVINQSDRLFLAKMVSVDEMGIYSVGYQVGMIILIVSSAFTNFFSPFLFERLNRNTEKDRIEIVKVSYIFIIGVFILLILLTALTPTLFSFFISSHFANGAKYVFWVGLSYFFWSIYLIFAGYVYFLKKNKILAYLSLLNVLLNLLLNYIFIKWLGAIGAAYATCLSFFVVSLIIGIIVQNLYPMPWFNWRKIVKY